MNKLFIFLSFLLVICLPINTGHGAPYWAKIYGNGFEWITEMNPAADGGYILTGYTAYHYPDYDIWVAKLDDQGEFSWSKSWGGSSRDQGFSIQQTDDDGDGMKDDGYIIAGITESLGAGHSDMCLMKLGSNGDISWQKTYGGSGYDGATSVQQTSDGGFIAAGSSDSFGAGYPDIWVLKLNSNGDISWQKTYGGSGYDSASSIQQTSDGGYIVAGSSSSFGNTAVWILKLDTDGDISWQKQYASSSYDESHSASSIQETTDGGYIVACNGTNSIFEDYPWILRIDSTGTIVWQKTCFASGRAYSIQQTIDGGYIMGGKTISITHWGTMWIVKFDSDGNVSWKTSFANVYAAGAAYSVIQTLDGGYTAAGRYRDMEDTIQPGPDGAMVLKLDSNGGISDCELLQTEPALYTFSASAQDTTVVFQPSVATVTETNVIPQDSSIEIIILCSSDRDEDGVPNSEDNCSDIANGPYLGTCTVGNAGSACIADAACGVHGFCSMAQEDSYPSDGNSIGDACDCEGNFNCDADNDVDGSDAALFKADFGRSAFNNPCNGITIFATGTNGAILHYDGSGWVEMETGTTESLGGVWGTSETDVFAVGGLSALHYDGTHWSPLSIGANTYLFDVWGAGANDIFVVGWDGDIFHYDGISWIQMDSGETVFLYSIWGSAADDIFIVGYDGLLLHYNGTQWYPMASGTSNSLWAIWGTSAYNVYAVGRNGTILQYDGVSWLPMDSGITETLLDVWGTAPDDIFAVGSFGTILHYNGTQWYPMTSGTSNSLWAIWGTGSNNVFAVGDESTIIRYDGTNWSPVSDVPYVASSIPDIWGISDTSCNGDFNCDGDADGTDAALFKSDFGRSAIQNPCPVCESGIAWCSYQ